MKEGRTFFYGRVSTKQQKLERQEENFRRAYPNIELIKDDGRKKNLYEDKYTGTTNNRDEWQKLRRRARKGDTIVFDSVSRMSRNAKEGVETYMNLFDKGINLVFLKESTINTDVYRAELNKSLELAKLANREDNTEDKDYINTFLAQLVEALTELFRNLATAQIEKAFEQSEKEVRDLRQRTSEGMQRAIAKGHIPGQKKGNGAKKATLKFADSKVLIIKLSKDFDGDMSDIDVMNQLRISRNTYYKYKKLIREELGHLEKTDIEKILKLKREDMRAYYQKEWNK